MFVFPQRPVQHRNEYESMAVLLYHMRKKGILRSFLEVDYGIDLEYEFVHNNSLIGKTIKIQLKSSNNLRYLHDGTPKIYNIKQSTLNYWAKMSYRTNVILVAVDISQEKKEKICVSPPLFWEIIKLIDPTKKNKHISLIGGEKISNELACTLIDSFALAPVVHEIILNQKIALQYLHEIFEFSYELTFHHGYLPVEDTTILQNLIDICSVLLWNVNVASFFKDMKKGEDWNKMSFYEENTKDGTLRNFDLYHPMDILVRVLLKKLIRMRKIVLESSLYWIVNGRDYLEMIYQYDIEKIYDKSLKEILIKYDGNKDNLLRNHTEITHYIDDEIKRYTEIYNL